MVTNVAMRRAGGGGGGREKETVRKIQASET
jgi:hypothetical protein